jgi:hypothetical protein
MPKIPKTYDTYRDDFALKGCTLLNTIEEYDSHIKSQRVKTFKIQYSCGHILDKCYHHMFMSRGSNAVCRICNTQTVSTLDMFDVEAESIKYLVGIIDSVFDVVICVESCKADVIIKPKSCADDKWLPLQLKSTLKAVSNQYKFVIKGGYTDEVGVCICLNEKRQWIFDEIPGIGRINIGTTARNKYSKYEVESPDGIISKLMELWHSKTKYKNIDINIASTDRVIIEQEYVKIREDSITCLAFEKPERNQLVYDFKVNSKKVQEKTSAKVVNKNGYSFKLSKNNGKKDNVRKYTPYHINDNDYYWLNLRHTSMFYVIPAVLLFEKGYLQSDGVIGQSYLYVTPNSGEWYDEYLFDYKVVDEEKLTKMFS